MILFSLTALCFLFGSTVSAGTIYTWTDADGVKRYSNSQPPEDEENVKTIREIRYDQQGDDKQRQEFDQMVEQASQSADRHFKEQDEKKAQAAEAERKQQLQARAERMAQERAELQKAIDLLERRGLSPTFSLGMKENLIRQVQDKINQLETNPDQYFAK
jgi:hypothetical protein